MNEYLQFKQYVNGLEADAQRYFIKGNQAAGIRFRKGLSAIRQQVIDLRKVASPTGPKKS